MYYMNYQFSKISCPLTLGQYCFISKSLGQKDMKDKYVPKTAQALQESNIAVNISKSSLSTLNHQACLTFNVIVRVMCKMETEHITSSTEGISLTLALLMSSSCAAFTFSGFPPHARSTDA